MRALADQVATAYDRAAVHAQRAGLPYQLLGWRHFGRFYGTTPVRELLASHEEKDPGELQNYWLRARRAVALAMLGRFVGARSIVSELLAEWSERGGGLARPSILGDAFPQLELLAGDAAAAARYGEEACRLLADLGQHGYLANAAGRLAHARYALGELDEAAAWAPRAKDLAASDDAIAQMLWRQALAKVLACRGEQAEAEHLAREAVAIGSDTEMLDTQADTYADLGEVLSLAGQPKQAAEAFKEALARYERKENLVMAERTRARLEDLQTTAAR